MTVMTAQKHAKELAARTSGIKLSSQMQQIHQKVSRTETQTTSQSGTVCNTNGAGLNVRLGPGTNYGRVGGLKEGAKVTVLSNENGWYLIQYGTLTGYVSGKYLSVSNSNDTGNQKQNEQETEEPASTNETEKSEEPGKEKQDDPIGTAKITAGSATVRDGAGYMYNRVFGLSKGKSVSVLQKKDGWLKISTNDKVGWIYGPYTDFDSFSSGTVTGDESLANFIRDNYPKGFNICFSYNGSNQTAEFTSQATSFSKEYHTLNIASGKLAKDTFLKVKTYSDLTSGILKTTAGVRKCLADHPRPGFDDSKCSVIRNLTIMCHGNTDSLNLGGGNFNASQVNDFAKTVNGYICSDVRVQLYACNTCRKPGTKEDWFERYNGEQILEDDPFTNGVGSFAQKLSVALGEEASVYGHTTAGHLSGNYAARCYGKDAGNAPNGKHMFDIYFPAWFVEEQAKRLKGSDSKANKDAVRLSMYKYYRATGNYPGNNNGRDTFIDPEGKGERMRAGWLAQNS